MMSNTDGLKLELVHVLFRHGDRTPDKTEIYPKDPDKSSEFEPFGHGQLTNEGKRRAYTLGKLLRNRYDKFLGQYHRDDVYARSTSFDRCKSSLQLVLAGLYPPTSELIWNEDLNWMPVPYDALPPENDLFFEIFRNSRFPGLMKQALSSPEITQRLEKYDKVLDRVTESTGLPRKFETLSLLYQNIESKKALGFPIPGWCDEKLLDDLKEANEILYTIFTHGRDLRKLFMGRFLETVVQSIRDQAGKKIHVYCAHDMTLFAFLRAHHYNEIRHIDYSSCLVLEKLRGKDGQQFVRLVYWPGSGDEFATLQLEGCDELCPLERYLELVDPVLPKEDDPLFERKSGEPVKWYINRSYSTE